MEKVRSWCGQPSDRGRLKNRTEQGFGCGLSSGSGLGLLRLNDKSGLGFD